jgi:hypothetical protein
MLSEVDKMKVAQNCRDFKPRSIGIMNGFGNMAESCSNCENLKGEECEKRRYDDIVRLININ